MKLRAPLYAKIACWLLANLLLVALLLGVFVEVQYHLGLDSLLAGRAGDRMAAVAGVISTELRTNDREKWDTVLAPFSESYQVQFSLYTDDGIRLAGDPTVLPPPVRAKLLEAPSRHELRPPHGPRPHENDDALRPAPDRPEILPPGPAGPPPPPPVGRPSMVRTANPALYWVLVRLNLDRPDRGPGPHPPPQLTLVAKSDSLGGGGLFFEWTPWLLAAAAVLTVSVLCWLPLVRGLTRSLRRMTEATGRIAEGRFDVRVAEESRGDELGALAGSINHMAARLNGFVTGQKRFLGDIAHELCAPLARLQMAAGILEQRAAPELHTNVTDLNEEIEQMSSLVGELLSFSRASLAGDGGARLTMVELRPIVDQAIRRESPDDAAAVENDVPAGLAARADAELLLRAIANLVRNSLRHAAGTGPIVVRAVANPDDKVSISVRDRGPGMPANALEQMFDPFYRLDPSRDRATGGVGLGLAIVKTCVEACAGTVAGRNLEPAGFEVTVTLPGETQAPVSRR